MRNKYKVTDRELDIIYLVHKGLTNQEIADKLCISVYTVKRHMTNIFSKMEIKSRTQLIILVNDDM